MTKRSALGKGIGALISSATQEGRHKYFLCPVEELRPHTRQPRKHFDDAKMAELVASIREKGVIQPLVVRNAGDHYQIIAGERRWRAAQRAGLKELPVVIQDVSEDWALEMALIENIQREDLNPIEEAEAYRHLMSSFDLSQDEVAKRVGKDRSTVANALRLLRLPSTVQQDVMSRPSVDGACPGPAPPGEWRPAAGSARPGGEEAAVGPPDRRAGQAPENGSAGGRPPQNRPTRN